ncbi:MAG: Hpt domain-containing protein [Spirochaetales bacterium]|nr:Hpt domain-containing protein [Spirochaetales bacterium]
MKKKSNTYMVFGILAGLPFPLAAWLVSYFLTDNVNVFIGLIGIAPIVLGIVGHAVDRREHVMRSMNADLERWIDERTSALRNLMDVSGQGLFTFDAQFMIEFEYSRACEEIFGEPIGGRQVQDLLFSHDPTAAQEFVQGLTLYFEGKTKADVIFDLLEQETIINGRFVEMQYREGPGNTVLCIITDVTSEKKLEETLRKENEQRNLVLRAVSHKHYFASYINEANELFELLRLFEDKTPVKKDLEMLMRRVHTFKGNSGFFGFVNTQEVAHDFEFYISDQMVYEEEIDFYEISIDLKKSYYAELKIIADTLGKKWIEDADSVVVPTKEYIKVENYVKKKYPTDVKLNAVLEHFRKIPVKDLFSRFPDIANNLASQLGKKISSFEIEGGEYTVLPEIFDSLVSSCIHLIRNMVDHGIESPGEREVQQKDPGGNIIIKIEKDSSRLNFTFSDDGRGISPRLITQKAVERGLIPEDSELSDREAYELIFHESLSTAQEITDISGRGVGLSAVKREVEVLGGTIEVNAKLNEGTTFTISLPLRITR